MTIFLYKYMPVHTWPEPSCFSRRVALPRDRCGWGAFAIPLPTAAAEAGRDITAHHHEYRKIHIQNHIQQGTKSCWSVGTAEAKWIHGYRVGWRVRKEADCQLGCFVMKIGAVKEVSWEAVVRTDCEIVFLIPKHLAWHPDL